VPLICMWSNAQVSSDAPRSQNRTIARVISENELKVYRAAKKARANKKMVRAEKCNELPMNAFATTHTGCAAN
jgi:hypothetical protein